MPGNFGSDFDPTAPADTSGAAQGAAFIRDVKTRIKNAFGPLFNLDTMAWLTGVVPSTALIDTLPGEDPTNLFTLPQIKVNSKGQLVYVSQGSAGSFKAAGSVETPATGGLGTNAVPVTGAIPIGNSAGNYTAARPTQGNGIIITLGDGALTFAVDPNIFPQIPFCVAGTLTAATAATPIQLLPDPVSTDEVFGRSIFVTDFVARVNGATPWATTSQISLIDNAGTPVTFAEIAVSALTANAAVGPWSAGVTLADALTKFTGGTLNRGLKVVGDVNGTGSDLIFRANGYFIVPPA